MAIDVGPAQGIVRRPTASPPTDKSVLWGEQFNPKNPNDVILRYFETCSQQWERVSDKDIFTRDYLTSGNGTTNFTLSFNVASGKENLARLNIRNLGEQYYGDDFTISDNILTFIADNFVLKTGDKLDVYYPIN